MRVMTFNVLCAGDGENHWCRRQPLVRDIIKKYEPDIFGIQEAHFGWMRYIADVSDGIDSFHWFGASSKMTDFVFVRNNVKVKKLKTATDMINGRYPSDHYPVVADIE